MTITGNAAVGVRAVGRQADVAVHPASPTAPPTSRRRSSHDNKVFYTSAYGTGGALLGLTARGRRGQGEGNLFHPRDAESSRRRRPGERLPLRLQQLDPDLPRVRDRRDDVAAPERRQGVAHLRRRPSLSPGRRQRGRTGGGGARPATRRRAGSPLPIRGCPAGRTRSSAAAGCTSATRARSPPTMCGCADTTLSDPKRTRLLHEAYEEGRRRSF